ncbi:MAG: hypothetical protein A3D74_00710 [Candidatus Levybacteria bacterium RIFCSPHIGHO2_02_FULL_37_13]|nr:MAG: hypothetical protein A3D74_00710 [Candidatus Levybacteria bacterium RIFCSPHIGHO2_02_FULL_37_13]OGH30722.1 MAG: hypothetical protein A3E40_03230 [Candidatus Levybacteria bacterium RIFCSPHIGHO2_12_FULL_37_9]OGH37941.1 MAG: hypothetical protein A3B41_05005 [Candidatus Levybacteria bacterium RIFCSPLOWO2_01_FULL_37_26]
MVKFKILWNAFGDKFGRTIIHPQFIKKTLEHNAIIEAKKYARGKLVDLGCGRMAYRGEFENLVDKYIGVDNPKLSKLYNADRKPDVIADIEKRLPFKDNSFDISLNFQVLEYITSPLPFLSEIYRILKPSGILILSVPFMYPLHDVPYDKYRYTANALKYILGKTGFSVLKVYSQGGFLEFWLQSLNVFFLKRILDIISSKRNIFSYAYLFFLVILCPFIVLISNIFIAIIRPFVKSFKSFQNDFPLEILIVAKKNE